MNLPTIDKDYDKNNNQPELIESYVTMSSI